MMNIINYNNIIIDIFQGFSHGGLSDNTEIDRNIIDACVPIIVWSVIQFFF